MFPSIIKMETTWRTCGMCMYVYLKKRRKKKDEEHVITKGQYTEGVHTFLYQFLKNKYINKNNNFIFSNVPFDSPFN